MSRVVLDRISCRAEVAPTEKATVDSRPLLRKVSLSYRIRALVARTRCVKCYALPRKWTRAQSLILRFVFRMLILSLLVTARLVPADAQSRGGAFVISGQVKDSLGRAIAGAEISLEERSGHVLGRAVSDNDGKFELTAPWPGSYLVVARKERFAVASKPLSIPAGASKTLPLELVMASLEPLTVAVSAERLDRAPNGLSASGNNAYTLTEKNIDQLPEGVNSPMDTVLLQMPGVVRDFNGQVHVRSEDANLQWRINGIMLPLDSFTGFGQVLSPYFIRTITLVDGALPAQYGYRNAGVLDIQTKDGCEDPGGRFELFGGQRETAQPSFQYGGCAGNLSFFTTGYFKHSDLGLSSATPGPTPIHDGVNEGQWFGYSSYFLNPTLRLSLISGVSVSNNQFPNYPGQVPQYSLAGVNPADYPSTMLNDNLYQRYYFAILALQGTSGTNLDYQLAYTAKYNTIRFSPDPIGNLIYSGVASSLFHSELANTLQGDLTYRLNQFHTLGAGVYIGNYDVTLDDTSRVFPANAQHQQTSDVPISIVDNVAGLEWLFGIYLQDHWVLSEKVALDLGVRWDAMTGFIGSANEPTPHANLTYAWSKDTTLHVGVARFFETPSFVTISPQSFNLFRNTTGGFGPGVPTAYPEDDWYFDAGFVHEVLPGLTVSQDNYFELQHDRLSIGQFPFVPIYAPFNWDQGRVWGSEFSISYRFNKQFSSGANFAYSVAQGKDIVTSQYNFTPALLDYAENHWVIQTHDQIFTGSTWAAYTIGPYFFSLDGLYGSGFHTGFANLEGMPYNWEIDLAAGRSFEVPRIGKLQTRLVIINIFDRTNFLRAAHGLGVLLPAYLPRRAIYLDVAAPLPAV